MPADDFSIVANWAKSIENLKLRGILFHNNFSESTILKNESEHLIFVKVDYDPTFNPNVYRYFLYKNFLENQGKAIENLFLTDVADVVLVQNPFISKYYSENPDTIFCGDEPTKLDNEWMQAHSTHFRGKISDYADFEMKFGNETLLNCGIIGGNIKIMNEFITKLCDIHQKYNSDNKTAYTGDMGAFNYLIRTQYNNQYLHGFPCNTVFKAYETKRTDCWFKHK